MSHDRALAVPTVTTDRGRVRGLWRDHRSADGTVSRAAIFLGIPYAASPVGDARFDAPRPPNRWDGVRPAVSYGPTPQRNSPFMVATIPEPSVPGESTLSVNVTTPDPSPGAALPVLVYIHGGGFIGGSAASPWYGGQAFARDGVVTVSMSYRLATEGFLWIDGAVNNRGVRDWLAGLEWVQRNIAAFGGDPTRVTIAGQSAGGSAVMRLLAMPAAQPLFTSVLALSPADATETVERARSLARRIAERAGVSADAVGFAAVDERRLFDARVAGSEPSSPDPLVALIADAPGMLALTPVIDGDVILESVEDALRAGVGADKALLIGSTAHEFNDVAASIMDLAAQCDPIDVLRRAGLPAGLAEAMVARDAHGGAVAAIAQAYSDVIFRRCVPGWALARTAGPGRSWAYDFRWTSRAAHLSGALHCLDLPFGFDILARDDARRVTGQAPQGLADAVHNDWLSLVRDGRVDAREFVNERATVIYLDDGSRAVATGYALEGDVWEATRA